MWKHNILGLTLNLVNPLYYILSISIISTLFCIEMNQKMDVGCRVNNYLVAKLCHGQSRVVYAQYLHYDGKENFYKAFGYF